MTNNVDYRMSKRRSVSPAKIKLSRLAIKNAIACDKNMNVTQKIKFLKSYETLIKNDKDAIDVLQSCMNQSIDKKSHVSGIIKLLRHKNSKSVKQPNNVTVPHKRVEYIKSLNKRVHSDCSKPEKLPMLDNLKDLLSPAKPSLLVRRSSKHNNSSIISFMKNRNKSLSINSSTFQGMM